MNTTPSSAHADRYCRSCTHLLRGVPSQRCPECGREFDPNDPRTTSAHPHGEFLPIVAKVTNILTVAVAVYAIACVIGSALGCDAYWMLFWTFMVVHVMFIVLVCALIPMVPLSWTRRVLAVTSIALIFSVHRTHWPLRVSFALHKPWLEAMSDRVKSGEVIDGRHRVGILCFRCIYLRENGNVGFHLSGGQGERMALVRDEPDSKLLWYNSATLADLGDNWYLVHED